MDDGLKKATDLQRKIGDVLLKEWDPIGVGDIPEARDEYSGYVREIFQLITSGATASQIAEHLGEMETETMGLSPREVEALLPVAEALVGLRTPRPT